MVLVIASYNHAHIYITFPTHILGNRLDLILTLQESTITSNIHTICMSIKNTFIVSISKFGFICVEKYFSTFSCYVVDIGSYEKFREGRIGL